MQSDEAAGNAMVSAGDPAWHDCEQAVDGGESTLVPGRAPPGRAAPTASTSRCAAAR
ncbi:hypothetical protein AB0F07_08625 [Streptomyces fructofermentans]